MHHNLDSTLQKGNDDDLYVDFLTIKNIKIWALGLDSHDFEVRASLRGS